MSNTRLTIYNTDGSALFLDVPITEGCSLEQKLMSRDAVTLSWYAREQTLIPMGSYLVCPLNGIRYYMATPYYPRVEAERVVRYDPEFIHELYLLKKIPFLLYTYAADGSVQGVESDWSFTGKGSDLLGLLAASIREGLGADYKIETDEFEAALSLSFSNTDIMSALSSICEAWGAEWADASEFRDGALSRVIKITRLYARGERLELTAGVEIESPESNQKDTYFNRFYVFGGTRNIPQDYNGAQANSVVNKRLTLNPSKYPQGYMDLPQFDGDGNALVDGDGNYLPDTTLAHTGRRFAKVLQFDDVYPRSNCRIKFGTLKSVQRYVRDGNDQKVQLADGAYDSWYLYAFALEYLDDTTGEWRDFRINKTTYSAASNPDGSLIKGQTLSLHFKSGALEGREFEASYHDADKAFRSEDGSEGFTATAGYFEVVHTEDNTVILPGPNIAPKAATTATSHDGDEVVVFNIRMPQEYYNDAYAELEAEAVKEIWEETRDSNEYTVDGNPVYFAENSPDLGLGRRVLLRMGHRELDTRVIALTRKLDQPFEQQITFSKTLRKGVLTTLRTEVASARQGIVEVAVQDDLKVRQGKQSLYAAQREMYDSMFDTDGNFTAPISPVAVQTAVVSVGATSANFQLGGVVFEPNYNDGAAGESFPNHFRVVANGGRLTHFGIDPDAVVPREWTVSTQDLSASLTSDTASYYLYAKCVAAGAACDFTLTTEQVRFDARMDTEGCYYFLAGVLSRVYTDSNGSYRVLNCTYGSTTVSGRFVKTGRIESVDSSTVIDLDKGLIKGNIQLASSSSDDQNKQFIDSLLGYSTDKAAMEGEIASAQTSAAAASSAAATAQTAADSAKDKVDNLKVGGRNYLLGTGTPYKLTNSDGRDLTAYLYQCASKSSPALKQGARLALSFDYDNQVTSGECRLHFHVTWYMVTKFTADNKGTGRVSMLYVPAKDLTRDSDASPSPLYLQGTFTGSVTMSNMKLEIGTSATDWTPAPEDVDDAIGAAQTTADSAKEAVDNMEVGGRNYILKTAATKAYTSTTSNPFNVRLGMISAGLAQRQVAMGENITVSFEFRADGDVGGAGSQWIVINGSGQWRTLGYTPQFSDTAGAWERRTHTWKWGDSFSQSIKDAPKDLTVDDEFVIGCNKSSSVVNIEIRRLKLEVGNKRTDWTPAPEDVDAAIEAAKNAAVEDVDVMYAIGTSSTTAPTSGWQTTAPAWESGKYMWQRTDITTGDGVTHTGTPTCIQGAAGKDGATGAKGDTGAAGRGIKSVQEQYYLSTSKTAQTGGSWQTTQPTWSAGKYVWTRSQITYSDNATGYSAATLSELFNKANETAATASSTAAAAQTTATTAKNTADAANTTANAAQTAANSAVALAGDPDNLFADQFLFNLSNTTAVTPPKGKARLCNNRDNVFGNEIVVTTGAKVTIEAVLLRHPDDATTISPRFGLWYTDTDEGVNAWVNYAVATNIGAVGMTDAWSKWRRVFTVPSGVRKGKFFLQIEKTSAEGDNTKGAFYASSVVVKMETRDYLREALEEATAGTTDVSGGLVLSKMMSVRDASNVMVAGMSGTSAATGGELPMMWAGADASTTSGLNAADFRVYSDGRAVMRNANIVGTSGAGNAVVINGATGKIELGASSGDGISGNAYTEITADKFSSINSALSSRGGGGNISGTIAASGSLKATMSDVIHNSSYNCLIEKKQQLGSVTIPSGTPGGTLFMDVPSGSFTGTMSALLSVAGDTTDEYWLSQITLSIAVCVYRNNSIVQYIGETSIHPIAYDEDPRRLYNSPQISGSIKATTLQCAYVVGDVFSVGATISLVAYNETDNLGGPFVSQFNASATVTNAGVGYGNSRVAYNNVLFGNGMLMSSMASNYMAILPTADSVMEASAGSTAASACMIKLSPNGLLHRVGTSTSWFKLSPVAYACLVNNSSSTYTVTNEYNPQKLTINVKFASQGQVNVTHTANRTLLPFCQIYNVSDYSCSVHSITSTGFTVKIQNQGSGRYANAAFLLILLDFQTF